MATAATVLAHISWGPLHLLLNLTPSRPPRRPHHTSAPSRPLPLLFLASLCYFQLCVFLSLYNLFSIFFSPITHHLSTKVVWVLLNWTIEGIGGFLKTWLESNVYSLPPKSRSPRCAVVESSCNPSCLGSHMSCCGWEVDTGVLPLCLIQLTLRSR